MENLKIEIKNRIVNYLRASSQLTMAVNELAEKWVTENIGNSDNITHVFGEMTTYDYISVHIMYEDGSEKIAGTINLS
jgi:hypothetical protein